MPFILVDGEVVEITEEEAARIAASWELRRRPDGTPEARKVATDGTVLVDWRTVPDRIVEAWERQRRLQRAKANVPTFISNVVGNSLAREILKILYAREVITDDDLEEAGISI